MSSTINCNGTLTITQSIQADGAKSMTYTFEGQTTFTIPNLFELSFAPKRKRDDELVDDEPSAKSNNVESEYAPCEPEYAPCEPDYPVHLMEPPRPESLPPIPQPEREPTYQPQYSPTDAELSKLTPQELQDTFERLLNPEERCDDSDVESKCEDEYDSDDESDADEFKDICLQCRKMSKSVLYVTNCCEAPICMFCAFKAVTCEEDGCDDVCARCNYALARGDFELHPECPEEYKTDLCYKNFHALLMDPETDYDEDEFEDDEFEYDECEDDECETQEIPTDDEQDAQSQVF